MMNLLGYAESLGLDMERFRDDMERHAYETRVAQDVESADLSGVSGTPTFFINGQRHYGAFDLPTLTAAMQVARERALTGQAPDWAPDEVDPKDFPDDATEEAPAS
jgi:predicted DsbA family dithiol-disulfide isomerase